MAKKKTSVKPMPRSSDPNTSNHVLTANTANIKGPLKRAHSKGHLLYGSCTRRT
jgi:hypothetical protein